MAQNLLHIPGGGGGGVREGGESDGKGGNQ